MEFDLLGPLRVQTPARRPVRLASVARRRLVSVLAMGADTSLSSDYLVDCLELSPGALRTSISRLRRILGEDVLVASPPGYLLRPDRTDVTQFEDLVAAARRATSDEEAITSLGAALALWRGDAYAEFAHEPWAIAEARRLTEARATATEDLADLLISGGKWSEAIGQLELLIVSFPFRDRPRSLLIRALMGSGRPAEARRQYQDYRSFLVEETGTEPSKELVELERTLLRAETTDTGAMVPVASGPRRYPIHRPRPLDARSTSELVGDEVVSVVAKVASAIESAASGQGPCVVLITGEPGIGKTTVLVEAIRQAFEGGVLTLFAHSEENLAAPFRVFTEMIRGISPEEFLSQPPPELAACATELAALTNPKTTEHGALAGASNVEGERYRLFTSVVDLMAALSADQPVVLALDDLQWSDEGSLQLLVHLVASNRATRVVVLATCRSADQRPAHDVIRALAELHRYVEVERVPLVGLNLAGVEALTSAMAGRDLDQGLRRLAHLIWRETDGNPFFTRQMIRHVFETTAMATTASGQESADIHPDDLDLPSTVREVVLARVAHLADPAADILTVAAVIGREFDLDVLSASTSLTSGNLLQSLTVCVEAGLVSESDESGGSYRFAHALIQRTLYSELGGASRSILHGRVAEALEDLCTDRPLARAVERARHWSLAPQPACAERALVALQRAAEVSLAEFAPEAALQFAESALRIANDPGTPSSAAGAPRITDIKVTLGCAQSQTGRAEYRTTLLEAAQNAAARDDVEQVARAALACDRGFFSVAGSVDGKKVQLLELALERLPADHPTRPLLLANLCQELTYSGSLTRRRALADEALALARACGDDAMVTRVSNCVFDALRLPSELTETLQRTDAALSRARTTGRPTVAISGPRSAATRPQPTPGTSPSSTVAWPSTPVGPPTRSAHDPLGAHLSSGQPGDASTGATDETEELAAAALELGEESGQPDAATIYAGQMFHVFWQRGSLRTASPLWRRLPPKIRTWPLSSRRWPSATPKESGSTTVWLSSTRRSPPDLTSHLTSSGARPCVASPRRLSCAAASNMRRSLGTSSCPMQANCATGATSEGPISRYLGGLATVMGQYEEADAHFSTAAVSCQSAGARFYGARNELWWGAMLLQRGANGDDERALELFRSAHQTAVEAGYPDLIRRATQALAEFLVAAG